MMISALESEDSSFSSSLSLAAHHGETDGVGAIFLTRPQSASRVCSSGVEPPPPPILQLEGNRGTRSLQKHTSKKQSSEESKMGKVLHTECLVGDCSTVGVKEGQDKIVQSQHTTLLS